MNGRLDLIEKVAIVLLKLSAIGIAALVVNYVFDELLKLVPR